MSTSSSLAKIETLVRASQRETSSAGTKEELDRLLRAVQDGDVLLSEAERAIAWMRRRGRTTATYAGEALEKTGADVEAIRGQTRRVPTGGPLGKMQRAVLESVRDHDDPVPAGTSYEERCRRNTVFSDMYQRGAIRSLGFNHPNVIAGRCGMYQLTPLGEKSLARNLAPSRLRRR